MNTIQELHLQCASAHEAVEQARVELGNALRSSDDKAKKAAAKKLTEAEAMVASLEGEISALEAADRQAERTAREQAEKRSAAQLQARMGKAKADLVTLREKGAGIDNAVSCLNDAVRDMDDAVRAYVNEHRDLILARWFRDWADTRGWIRPFKSYLLNRAHPAITVNMRNKYTDHFHGSTAENVPDFDTVMGTKAKGADA